MGLDLAQYARVMDDFLVKMEKIPSLHHAGIRDAVSGLCALLRVSRVRLIDYESAREQEEGEGEEIIYFDGGCADPNRCMDSKEALGTGNVMVHELYQYQGEEDWSPEEKKELRVFLRMLVAFSGRMCAVRAAEELAYWDKGLGIYNFNYYRRVLGELIGQKRIGKYGAAFFNLRHFSLVNQRIGREEATRVISSFIRGLQEKLSGEEYVCRVGGDNFAVLFYKENLHTVMEYLAGTEIESRASHEKLLIMASAGYYMIPDGCASPEQIVDSIGEAVKIARTVSREPYAFYDEKTVKMLEHAKKIESVFPTALKHGEFVVYYQPKVHLTDYRLTGAEALCRWVRNGMIVPPDEFIPILEQSDAICKLDFYMLESVCRDIRQWLDEGRDVVKVSVNLSRCHMGNPELLSRILEIVDRYEVPHGYIEIELTETMTDVAFQDLKRIVSGLQSAGISTAVDDFGIGYSSLNLIRELPWNVLKIDKTFLAVMDNGVTPNYMLLKHVIAMAHDIGLECIVEGVETAEHVQMLKENNCYLAQGFFFDRPLPKEKFMARLETKQASC